MCVIDVFNTLVCFLSICVFVCLLHYVSAAFVSIWILIVVSKANIVIDLLIE